ncbi:RDD family protein [Streptomyces filamentosus]|uniref:RDD family protein n=1 Tax=Streptomyces filamentosus TaxID=67294 RepID=UPI0033D0445E
MATPPGGGGEVPQAGYYPDPSIPGYIRYWNGGSWVPGTSRPAPKDGEVAPVPPASAMPAGPVLAPSPAPAPVPAAPPAPEPAPAAAVEETGPLFFDEEPPVREPAAAWRADASRQAGHGEDRGAPAAWSAPAAPAPAADPAPAPAVPDPRSPVEWPAAPAQAETAAPAADPRLAGTPARLGGMPVTPAPAPVRETPAPAPAPVQPQPAQPHPVQPQPVQPQPQPVQPAPQAHPHPQPAAPSWAHPAPEPQAQVQAPQQPVVPWKPPVEDPFLQAVREQSSAPPAGLGRRLLARVVDTLLLGAMAAGAAFPFVTAALEHIDAKIEAAKRSGVTVQVWLVDGTTSVQFGIALGLLLVLGVLYEALPTAKWGRTLGKKLCGIQVRDIEAHEPPTLGRALRRWFLYTFLGLLVIGVLNVLWCVFDRPWRQCWHDKAARTFVARA